MPFAAGTFPFPTSTGDFSVTGLGFEPEMVIFFGGNQATEDTLLTGLTRPGLFLSMCAIDYASSDINSECISIASNSAGGGTIYGYSRTWSVTGGLPIRMQNNVSGSQIDYRASQITFDADGFTLTVQNAAPANRPIHWWAVNSEEAGLGSELAINTTGSFDGGFQIQSMLGLAGPTNDDSSQNGGDSDSWLFFGTNHWPNDATITGTRMSALTHTGLNSVGPGGRQGWTEIFQYTGVNGERLVFDLGTAGVALAEGYTHAVPDVLFGTTAVINSGDTDVHDQTSVVWTGVPGHAQNVGVDADIGDVVSVSVPSWFDIFGIVMFTNVNGANAVGNGPDPTSGALRYGIGILHESYQGCIAVGDDGSFYQSTSQCVANTTASGFSAAEGTILGPTFELETVANGVGLFNTNYHAFGLPGGAWLPQMYRWWRPVPQ